MADGIETPARKRLHLVAGRFNRQLALDIAANLGVEPAEANVATFANGEIHCRYADSMRGADVFI
jgi:ribose-phosphate pyrophosphokinase